MHTSSKAVYTPSLLQGKSKYKVLTKDESDSVLLLLGSWNLLTDQDSRHKAVPTRREARVHPLLSETLNLSQSIRKTEINL